MGKFNRLAAVQYAVKWALGRNPEFPDYDGHGQGGIGDDCTNFISQIMLAGGWMVVPGLKRDSTAWWTTRKESSWTWAAAKNFGDFAKWSHRVRSCTRDELDLGDLVQFINPGDDVPHHTMVVTQKLSGRIYLSAHSNNRLNIQLEGVQQIQERIGSFKYLYWKIADVFPEMTSKSLPGMSPYDFDSSIIASVPPYFDSPNNEEVPLPIRITQRDDSFVAIPGDALFDFDKDVIKPGAEPELLRAGAIVQMHLMAAPAGSFVLVNGHTDSIGNKAYNQDLSERRARAVAKWLTDHKFVRADQVRTQGFGSERARAFKNDPIGRGKDRRVEFYVIKR